MYTLEQLQSKTFKALKGIGQELNVLPEGDRRQKQTWIDAIAGVNPPLLEVLEVSPGVEVESVAEAIEVQVQETIEYGRITGYLCRSKPIESKFDRIVYPKLATEPIAPAAENSPGVTFDPAEFRETHAAEIENYFASFTEADRPPNRGDGKGRLEVEPELSQSAIALAAETSPGVENCTEADRPPNRGDNGRGRIESELELTESAIAPTAENLSRSESDLNPILTGITFSHRFLALYSPPQSENIHFKANADGQLSLLDFEIESADEPPDPDDFESMFAFWAAYDAWCERTDDDSEQFEPLEISLTSMCEWAPCPEEWYEPETNETNETVSCTLEISSMLELPILFDICANESSITCNFSIPTFDAWCDRPNGKDEPPTAGVGARLPKPKPPSFPSAVVGKGDRSSIKQFARSAILLSGRAPPGGDAMS